MAEDNANGEVKPNGDGGDTPRQLTEEYWNECKAGIDSIIQHCIDVAAKTQDVKLAAAADILMLINEVDVALLCVRADKNEEDEAKRKMQELEEKQAAGRLGMDCMAAVVKAHYKARGADKVEEPKPEADTADAGDGAPSDDTAEHLAKSIVDAVANGNKEGQKND